MKIFLLGGSKSGKSDFAQEIALRLAHGGRRYYVATMRPVDGEDHARIASHLRRREGMGFETIECSSEILSLQALVSPEGAFLLDSVTALMSNAFFPPEKGYAPDDAAARRCTAQLLDLLNWMEHAVIVSDFIFSDAQRFDDVTRRYLDHLGACSRSLAAACDTVVEMQCGIPILHKGGLPR